MRNTKELVEEDWERIHLTDQIFLEEYIREMEMDLLWFEEEIIIQGKIPELDEITNIKDKPYKVQEPT